MHQMISRFCDTPPYLFEIGVLFSVGSFPFGQCDFSGDADLFPLNPA